MNLHIAALHLHFQLYGCHSIKDKRRVFSALRAVWGRETDLALMETGDQDDLTSAHWSIVAVGPSPAAVQHRLDLVEKTIAARIDAPILAARIEWC